MNQKYTVWAGAAIVIIIAIFYALSAGETTEQYVEKIQKERDRQFKFLKFNAESPLTDEQKKKLDQLEHYPINPAYRVKARLVPVSNRMILEIPMTDGTVEKYVKHSYAEFMINGSSERLLLLQSVKEQDKRQFFLGFADDTSAGETYGGGRYIDVKLDGQHTATIDFNMAYNPYCAYNPEYSCPIPPKENLLSIPIRAGEKN